MTKNVSWIFEITIKEGQLAYCTLVDPQFYRIGVPIPAEYAHISQAGTPHNIV